jgi:hypothetical protein
MAGKTVIVDIEGHTFPPCEVEAGTYVVWRNLDPVPHSAETRTDAELYFSGGALLPGEAGTPVLFERPGTFPYLCRFHAAMKGEVTVRPSGTPAPPVRVPDRGHEPAPADEDDPHAGHGGGGGGGDDDYFKHLHGFVTGGRSGRRLFMTHTPVIADPRHCYQVILQGSFARPEHVEAYDAVRAEHGSVRADVYHQHLSLPAIGRGEIAELDKAEIYFEVPSFEDGVGPGLGGKLPIRIDRVLHFHTFAPDSDYPDGLAYLVYGDDEDVFIDHLITRAPNFHSVAKLEGRPDWWPGAGADPLVVVVPGKRIRDVSPREIKRVAIVDNAFHLFWLPPPGALPNQAVDPLAPRTGDRPAEYDVVLEGGRTGRMSIERFLHFDVRLLDYGVLLPDE